MSDIPLPPLAKPHEVAIITFYWQCRSARIVAKRLHYKDQRPVQFVLAKYRDWLCQHGMTHESPGI